MIFGPIPTDDPLTEDEVAQLTDGAEVIVLWGGGNGPHRYRIHVVGDDRYAGDPRNDNVLDFIGSERYHNRVWLADERVPESECKRFRHDEHCDHFTD